MNLKKWKGIFTSKFVGTGPSSYDNRIYRAAVSQSLRNTDLVDTHNAIFPSCTSACKATWYAANTSQVVHRTANLA